MARRSVLLSATLVWALGAFADAGPSVAAEVVANVEIFDPTSLLTAANRASIMIDTTAIISIHLALDMGGIGSPAEAASVFEGHFDLVGYDPTDPGSFVDLAPLAANIEASWSTAAGLGSVTHTFLGSEGIWLVETAIPTGGTPNNILGGMMLVARYAVTGKNPGVFDLRLMDTTRVGMDTLTGTELVPIGESAAPGVPAAVPLAVLAQIVVVPEPGTALLFSCVLIGVVGLRRCRTD